MADTVLLYYSLTGLNDVIADRVRQKTGADVVKLEPDFNYPKAMYSCWDIVRKWRGVGSIPKHGQPLPDISKAPQLKGSLPDLAGYQRVLIGGPVWGWTMADPIMTFLTSANLSGKDVYAYWTCVNTDYNYEVDFKSLLPADAKYRKDLCIDSEISDNPEHLEQSLNQLLEFGD